VALLAIPAVFATGWVTAGLTQNLAVRGVLDTGIRIALFAVLVVANRRLMARHWRKFWAAPWGSVVVVVVGMIVIQIVISALGALLRPLAGAPGTAPSHNSPVAFAALLVISLQPIATALIEDFVFRHTLMLGLLIRHRAAFIGAVAIVNALLFGAVHINNFDGVWLLTLSYAGAGLVMNLAYLWTRNIWHVLLMHGLNNFLLAGPLIVVFTSLLGGAH